MLYLQREDAGVNYIYLGKKLIAKDGVIPEKQPKQHFAPFGSSLEGEIDGVGYTGHKHDTDIGLTYMQARYYDPVLGRFYSNDPIGYRGVHSFNRYAYANNNPYKFIDPTGMSSVIHGCTPKQGGGYSCTGQVGNNSNRTDENPVKPSSKVSEGGAQQGKVAAAEKAIQEGVNSGDIDPSKIFTGSNALDLAAKEILSVVHPISEEFQLEIGGRIVVNGDGYSYEVPTVGTVRGVDINGAGAAGGYHTHPGGYGYRYFSSSISNAGRLSDVGWVKSWKIPLYMSHLGKNGAKIHYKACMPRSAACSTATPNVRSRRGREL